MDYRKKVIEVLPKMIEAVGSHAIVESIGVTRQAVHFWKTGKIIPTAHHFLQLAHMAGYINDELSFEALFRIDDKTNEDALNEFS
jgi:hypothetical protein